MGQEQVSSPLLLAKQGPEIRINVCVNLTRYLAQLQNNKPMSNCSDSTEPSSLLQLRSRITGDCPSVAETDVITQEAPAPPLE